VINLKNLSEIGLQAVDTLQAGKSAQSAWAVKTQKVIDESRKGYGKTELMIVKPIEELIKAAVSDSTKNTNPEK